MTIHSVITFIGPFSASHFEDFKTQAQSFDMLSTTMESFQHAQLDYHKLSLQTSFDPLENNDFRDWLRYYAHELSLDVGLESKAASQQSIKLAVFDMDSTLLKAEVIDELAVEYGVDQDVKAITELAMQGAIDFKESFAKRMALLKGLPESAVQNVMARLPLMDGALDAFAFFQAQGLHTAIFSGGFDIFARSVQDQLNINEIVTNQLAFENGVLTGQVVEPVIDAQAKANALEDLVHRLNIKPEETMAVGDGANDLLMLAAAGKGVAFRAKPAVKARAYFSIDHHGLEALPCFFSL